MNDSPIDAFANDSSIDAFANSWRDDPGFRARIDANPRTALAEWGLDMPAGAVSARVVEDTPEVLHVVFPPPPGVVLSDAELDGVAGGFGLGGDPQPNRHRWNTYYGWARPNG